MPRAMQGGNFLNNAVHAFSDFISTIVDAVNHMIRPGILIWLIGGFTGAWPLPNLSGADPALSTIFMWAVNFWYGGRILAKDVPAMLKALRQK